MENKYIIEKKIGEGGSSQVYLARDRLLGKKWAIKVVSRQNADGVREAMLMKNLEHKSIPRIVDVFEQAEHFYIVMDYIEGKSLRELFIKKKKWNSQRIQFYLIQLCEILEYLHTKTVGIVLCDLKPENIIIKEDSLFLIDFGFAIRCGEHLNVTKFGGTRGYSAPELYTNPVVVDERADIYSLGRIMKEFYSTHCIRIRNKRKVKKIIKKCCNTYQEKRYESVLKIKKELLALQFAGEKQERKEKKKKGVVWLLVIGLIFLQISFKSINKERTKHKYEKRQENSIEEVVKKIKNRREITREEEEKILKDWQRQFGFSIERFENNQISQKEGRISYQIAMLFLDYYTAENGFSHILKAQMWFEIYLASKQKASNEKAKNKVAQAVCYQAEQIKKCQKDAILFLEKNIKIIPSDLKMCKLPSSKSPFFNTSKVSFSPYISHFGVFIVKDESMCVTIEAKDERNHKIKGIEYYIEENGEKKKKIEYQKGNRISVFIRQNFNGKIYARAVCEKGEVGRKFVASQHLSFEIKRNEEYQIGKRTEENTEKDIQRSFEIETQRETERKTIEQKEQGKIEKERKTEAEASSETKKEKEMQEESMKIKEEKRVLCVKNEDFQIIQITQFCYYLFDEHGLKDIKTEYKKRKIPYKQWQNLIFVDATKVQSGKLKFELKNYLGNQQILYPQN